MEELFKFVFKMEEVFSDKMTDLMKFLSGIKDLSENEEMKRLIDDLKKKHEALDESLNNLSSYMMECGKRADHKTHDVFGRKLK